MSSALDAQLDAAAPLASEPPVPVGEDAGETARLEALLLARSGEVRDLDAEVGRLRSLLRDALAQLDDLGAPQEGGASGGAIARALDAESARAQAELRLDEALGCLTRLPPLETELAQLAGATRGLCARALDAEEARDAAEARLVLARDDLAVEEGRRAALLRELADTGEQLDLATAREHALAADAARIAMELRAETVGLRAARDEAEAALEASRERAERGAREQRAGQGGAEAQLVRARELLARTREELRQLVDAVARAAAGEGEQAVADITLPGVESPSDSSEGYSSMASKRSRSS